MAITVEGYAEVRSDGRWAFGGRMVQNPFHGYDPDEPEVLPEALFSSNTKELAAILTDTCNPVRSVYPYTPVVPPRGLPPDLSSELATWLRWREEQGEAWERSTWFTVREAADFGWDDRMMRRRAYVAPEAAALFAGCPRGFPLAAWPSGLPVMYGGWSSEGVAVEWRESYAEIVPEFARDVLPRLGRFGPPDHVRLIVVASW